uniref:Uncharacterized protein n=1 Tax=Caenorhabditis japonica TaxID=281687 RepID=A0A8R1EMJ9_CAEJA
MVFAIRSISTSVLVPCKQCNQMRGWLDTKSWRRNQRYYQKTAAGQQQKARSTFSMLSFHSSCRRQGHSHRNRLDLERQSTMESSAGQSPHQCCFLGD